MAYSKEEREDIINSICAHISEKNQSLRSALLLEGMPDKNQFYKWIRENESFREQYARACEERADHIFEEILEITDDNALDISVDSDGNAKVNGEVVNRSRLKVDARKWMLSKMNPKKYGDKQEIDHTTKGEKIQPITGFDVK